MNDPVLSVSACRRGRCSRWLLREDGVVDEIAVEVAAAGTRPVRLTPTERRLAAALILCRGGSVTDIANRLHITWRLARALAREAGFPNAPGAGTARGVGEAA
jgi:hypothetical protein